MNKKELVDRFVNGQEGHNHNAESFIHSSGNSFILHSTTIVHVLNNTLTLDTNGWETQTTKSYMNMILEALDLPNKVVQRKGEWILQTSRGGLVVNEKQFKDGMTLKLN